jgi:predicted acylesterase/phospholipase RssA/CRP-like cAMP-binding protein
MTEGSPIDRLRRAGLQGAILDLLGVKEGEVVREIEARVRWVELPRGAQLYRQGDAADDLHIVVSGRLRAVTEDGRGRLTPVGEISRGQTVGEMALLAGQTRAASVYAVRDTVLLGLDRSALETVVARHPRLVLNMSRLVGERLRRAMHGQEFPARVGAVAIAPHGSGDESAAFARRLAVALDPMGGATIVDAERARRELHADGGDELAHRAALDTLELTHGCVIYLTERAVTPWTVRCVRQADTVVVVARFDAEPTAGPVEAWLTGDLDPIRGPRRELVLLHDDGSVPPQNTARWLSGRKVDRHHHVRLDRDGDVARIARFLSGRAVGLVLAGGGAPGLAHVGAIRALREAGVPIDAVGGTSIGSIVAAGVALDFDDVRLAREMRAGFVESNPLGDYRLLPLVSLSKGRRMERRLRSSLGDAAIEDAWLPFLCVSADISANAQHVHTTGPLWRAVRTSASIPGVLPPMVEGNHLLIDGSSVNNLPVELMRELGAARIIAADLDLKMERELGYKEVPSPWRVLAGRFLPGVKRLPVPGLMNVVMKSTMIAGMERAARTRESVDLYLAPQVQRIGLLRWDAFDQLVEIGYRHAEEALRAESVGLRLGADRTHRPS